MNLNHAHRRRRRFLLLVLLCETALFAAIQSAEVFRVPPPPPQVAPQVPSPTVKAEEGITPVTRLTFEAGLPGWEEKVFKGKPVYKVEEGDPGICFLDARTDNACSGLFRRIEEVPATPDLFIEWSWSASAFPKKRQPDKLSNRREDDFAARLYLIFPVSNFFKSEVIEYVWDESVPVGHHEESPYSDRIQLFVIRSGPSAEGMVTERRNVYDDYRQLFKKEPKRPLGIVAVMSDSDNTGTTSQARFGPVNLFRKKIIPTIQGGESS